MDLIAIPKVNTLEGKRVRHAPLLIAFRGRRRVENIGWGFSKLISKSINHTHLYKLNSKLVNAEVEHFWSIDEPWANMDS